MIIGVTGQVGSGKTTLCGIFARYGFFLIDADEIGHEIIKKGSPEYKKVVKFFGNNILDKDKNIDRKKLGDLVFYDPLKLNKLNSILHPPILKKINKIINEKKGRDTIIDAPLLFESSMQGMFGKIIVVCSNQENIFRRLRKKYPRKKIEKILKLQIPAQEKVKGADFVVDNNKNLLHLKNQAKKIVDLIKK